MSTNADFDRIAEAWLAEGPTELADRLLDAALDEVHLTHQRRRWAPWRNAPMYSLFSTLAGRATIAIVIAAVAVGGWIALRPSVSVGPAATPTDHASPVAAATPVASNRRCTQALVPTLLLAPDCEYFTTSFGVPLTITANDDWLVSAESAHGLAFQGYGATRYNVVVDIAIVDGLLVNPCEYASDLSTDPVPRTPEAYLAWLETKAPGLVSTPVSTLGFEGKAVDIPALSGQAAQDAVCFQLVLAESGGGPVPGRTYPNPDTVLLSRTRPARLLVLDGGGTVILVAIEALPTEAGNLDAAEAWVDSFQRVP